MISAKEYLIATKTRYIDVERIECDGDQLFEYISIGSEIYRAIGDKEVLVGVITDKLVTHLFSISPTPTFNENSIRYSDLQIERSRLLIELFDSGEWLFHL